MNISNSAVNHAPWERRRRSAKAWTDGQDDRDGQRPEQTPTLYHVAVRVSECQYITRLKHIFNA